MPSISASSSSVFGRLTGKRQNHKNNNDNDNDDDDNDNHHHHHNNDSNSTSSPQAASATATATATATTASTPPPPDAISETDRKRLHGHRRESSVLSLPSSVSDLGQSVRRSVSLRSHRTQHSTSSIGHRPRYPSSGNLLHTSNKTSPLASPTEASSSQAAKPPNEAAPSHSPPPPQQQQPQPPPRARGSKLSISARSFSQRFKSTDNSSILAAPDQLESGSTTNTTASSRAPPPSLPPATITEPARSHHSMLATQPIPRRPPPDRPAHAPQSSLTRDISTSHGLPPQNVPSSLTTTTSGGGGGGFNPHTIHQTIHETAAKRMATIDYLRKVHDGNVFYFSTFHYTPNTLSTTIPSLSPPKLGRRATNYLLLGYSLPALLDMSASSPQEYLKALSSLLSEFETYQSLAGTDSSGGSSSLSRARVGQMLKSGMGLTSRAAGMSRSGRRASAATDSISLDASKATSLLLGLPATSSSSYDAASNPQDVPSPVNLTGHDFHFLLTPHIPFEPDFHTVFATLCDTLRDTYARLLELVGSNPEVCTPAVGEVFAKADKSVRKILVANVVREFEEGTRGSVKGEVAGLGRLVLGGLM